MEITEQEIISKIEKREMKSRRFKSTLKFSLIAGISALLGPTIAYYVFTKAQLFVFGETFPATVGLFLTGMMTAGALIAAIASTADHFTTYEE